MDIAFLLMAQAANNLCDCAQKHCFPTWLATVLLQSGLMRGFGKRLGLQTLVLSCFVLAACMLNSTANVRAVPYRPFVGYSTRDPSQRLIPCPRLDNQNGLVESTKTMLKRCGQKLPKWGSQAVTQAAGAFVNAELSNLMEDPIPQSDQDDVRNCRALVPSLKRLVKLILPEPGDETPEDLTEFKLLVEEFVPRVAGRERKADKYKKKSFAGRTWSKAKRETRELKEDSKDLRRLGRRIMFTLVVNMGHVLVRQSEQIDQLTSLVHNVRSDISDLDEKVDQLTSFGHNVSSDISDVAGRIECMSNRTVEASNQLQNQTFQKIDRLAGILEQQSRQSRILNILYFATYLIFLASFCVSRSVKV